MFSRVFTLFTLFTLFACMLLGAQASPVALADVATAEIDRRACNFRLGSCRLAQADEASTTVSAPAAGETGLPAPEPVAEPTEGDKTSLGSTPETESVPELESTTEFSAATSAASLAVPSAVGTTILMAALAGSFAVLL